MNNELMTNLQNLEQNYKYLEDLSEKNISSLVMESNTSNFLECKIYLHTPDIRGFNMIFVFNMIWSFFDQTISKNMMFDLLNYIYDFIEAILCNTWLTNLSIMSLCNIWQSTQLASTKSCQQYPTPNSNSIPIFTPSPKSWFWKSNYDWQNLQQ